MPEDVLINPDAFSSGQISSKLWLCKELENLGIDRPMITWIYGGWYGISAMLLFSRGCFPIKHIRNFDMDPNCAAVADILLENWVWQAWKFKAFTADCNQLSVLDGKYGPPPDLIINTSTEHFTSSAWFDKIPSGTLVALQSNNMPHDDHHSCMSTEDDIVDAFPLSTISYTGSLEFDYPSWSFTRYMMIGMK
jgi:hypothetical protein